MKVCIDVPLVAISLVFALSASISVEQRLSHTGTLSKRTLASSTVIQEDYHHHWEPGNIEAQNPLQYPPTISQEHVLELWGIVEQQVQL